MAASPVEFAVVSSKELGLLLKDAGSQWVQPKPGRGIWGFVRDRFLSVSMVMGTAFLLLVSLLWRAAQDGARASKSLSASRSTGLTR